MHVQVASHRVDQAFDGGRYGLSSLSRSGLVRHRFATGEILLFHDPSSRTNSESRVVMASSAQPTIVWNRPLFLDGVGTLLLTKIGTMSTIARQVRCCLSCRGLANEIQIVWQMLWPSGSFPPCFFTSFDFSLSSP